jgi:ABC-type ATPase involved in cell division
MAMPRALQLRGVRKRFVAGTGSCLASADVLRGIDLDLDCGESVAVVGAAGSGKSTLLLCASGLIRSDAGTTTWFGDSAPFAAATRVRYCFSVGDLASVVANDEARLYLVDLPPAIGMSATVVDWVGEQCETGSAVLIAARDERLVHRAADRVLTISGGILHSTRSIQSRVAESVVSVRRRFVDHLSGGL